MATSNRRELERTAYYGSNYYGSNSSFMMAPLSYEETRAQTKST